MSFTLVGSASAASTDNTNVTTAAIDTTGADMIVVASWWDNASAQVSDSKSNTWTNIRIEQQGVSPNALILRLSVCFNPIVGSGHTFTASFANALPSISVQAWRGSTGVSGGNSGANQASGATLQPGSLTAVGAGALFVTADLHTSTGGDASSSVNSGFVETSDIDPGATGQRAGAFAYKIQGVAGAENPTWTVSAAIGPAARIASMVLFETKEVTVVPPMGWVGQWPTVVRTGSR